MNAKPAGRTAIRGCGEGSEMEEPKNEALGGLGAKDGERLKKLIEPV